MPAYKLSRFTHVLSSSDSSKRYVYNPVSNGLAAVDDAAAEMLLQGDAGIDMLGSKAEHAQLLNDLRSGQMIVEEDLDEVEFMRVKMNLSRYGTLGLSLTIVPTLGCNLACTYCYEGLDSVRFMSPEVQESVVAFAKAQVERFGYRSLSVTWYGGEPLLRPELIYDLSRKLIDLCDELKIHYTAMVVTNGTTLTPAMAQELKDLKVSHIQVTIDGPREVHDLRRPFRGHTRSSFDVITSNVDRIVDILPVHIRINVDKTNYQRCLELVDQMRSKGWFESGRQCGFYLGFTRVWTQVCNSIANQCFTMKQFSETELKFQRDLLNAGFTLGNLYPARTAYCVAVGLNGFVVDPDGELYKCWADVNNPRASVGNTARPLELNASLLKWLSYEPLQQFPKCRDCGVFPICAGGCPSVAIQSRNEYGDDDNCTPWKLLMDQKIDVFLDQLSRQPAKTEMKGDEHAVVSGTRT